MKKTFSTICIIAWAVSFALTVRAGEETPVVPAPNITCPDPTYNFGKKANSERVTHEFEIKNTGNATLEIKRAKPTCGCTVARISKKSVAPGESAYISSTLSLKNRRGRVRKAIKVYSNDPDSPQYSLYFDGEAYPLYEARPKKLFVRLSPESLTVTNESMITFPGTPFYPVRVKSSSEFFEAHLDTVEEGKEYRVRIVTVPPAPGPRTSGKIELYNAANQRVADLEMDAIMREPLFYSPKKLALPADADQPLSRTILIRGDGIRTFEIRGITTPVGEAQMKKNVVNGVTHYQITVSQMRPSPKLDGMTVTIRTDVAGREEIKIPIRIQ